MIKLKRKKKLKQSKLKVNNEKKTHSTSLSHFLNQLQTKKRNHKQLRFQTIHYD